MSAPTQGPVLAADEAHAAAIAALGLAPATLRRLLAGIPPVEAWERLLTGSHPADPERRLQRRVAAARRPDAVAEACVRAQARTLLAGTAGYPAFLRGEGPAVLFVVGDWGDAVERVRVTVVGTRAPSRLGVQVAEELGGELARRGVVVVSGLARGIDAAAHRGALNAGGGVPVVAVLGTAPDGPLTADAAGLRRRIAGQGAVLSEVAPGTPSQRWMFAVRNRVMAAAADVVVVVESHAAGGSLHTVRAAQRLGVPVAAVPGSVVNRAADGTNALLATGAAVAVRDADDVLALVGRPSARVGASQPRLPLGEVGPPPPPPNPRRHRAVGAVATPAPDERLLAAVDQVPADTATVAARAGLTIGAAALGLRRLADARFVLEEHGWWVKAR